MHFVFPPIINTVFDLFFFRLEPDCSETEDVCFPVCVNSIEQIILGIKKKK